MLITKLKIKQLVWQIHSLPNSEFDQHFGKTTQAITTYLHETGYRSMFFRKTERSYATIVHELMHAYLSYKDLSKFSYGTIEEHVADVVGINYKQLGKHADKIENALILTRYSSKR